MSIKKKHLALKHIRKALKHLEKSNKPDWYLKDLKSLAASLASEIRQDKARIIDRNTPYYGG